MTEYIYIEVASEVTSTDVPEIALEGSDFRSQYDPRPVINYIFDILFEGFNEYSPDSAEFI